MNRFKDDKGLSEEWAKRFHLPQIENCDGCGAKGPCSVDREKSPTMWWMHQAITLRNELAFRSQLNLFYDKD